MDVTTLPATASVDECLSIIRRDGCVIVRILAVPVLMDAIRSELDPFLQKTPYCEGYFVGYGTKRMGGLVIKSPALA